MAVIAGVESAILAQVEATLGATVKVKESLGGAWTLDTLKRALQMAPGIYVAFLGGRGVANADGYIEGRFAVYAVTKGPVEPLRRQGTPREIGAYDIVERLVPVLAGLAVTDVGKLHVQEIANLFQEAAFSLGGSVYGITLVLPNMPMTYRADLAGPAETTGLGPFLLFHAEHSLMAGEDEPAAIDEVNLPQ